jgi:hypothetical protein
VRATLGRGDFIDRYVSDDGLAGGEGAFIVCSSWLIDAELAAGRIDAARSLLDRPLACGNDVGLYAKEVDAASHAFLGNFPQARRGRHHHTGGVEVHHTSCQLVHRREAGPRSADHHRHLPACPCQHLLDEDTRLFGVSLVASPMMPSTVRPVKPACRQKSTMRSVLARSSAPLSLKGVTVISYTPVASASSVLGMRLFAFQGTPRLAAGCKRLRNSCSANAAITRPKPTMSATMPG